MNDETTISMGDDSAIAFELTRAIDTLFKKRSKCLACGGILPEICVLYGGRKFKLVCYDIVKGKKSLLKTDYEKVSRYATAISRERLVRD